MPQYWLYSYTGDGLIYTIQDCKPDVLMLWCDQQHAGWAAEWRKLFDSRPELGLRLVPTAQLPPSCQTPETGKAAEWWIVAVRKELLPAAMRGQERREIAVRVLETTCATAWNKQCLPKGPTPCAALLVPSSGTPASPFLGVPHVYSGCRRRKLPHAATHSGKISR